MTEFSTARRRLMRNSAAWIGGLAVLGTARTAGAAMQGYELSPTSPLGIAVKNRCGPSAGHAAIAAELRARLAADPALTTLTERCPICGCPIIVSR
jgi:hypothetical protein